MEKYLISFGIGQSLTHTVEECKNIEEAENIGWSESAQEYDSMAGMHGLRTREEIMEEEECDEIEADMTYREERESELDYSAELYDEDKHKDYL